MAFICFSERGQTLQIGKDDDKKGIEISKIYVLSFNWVPMLWRMRSRHQYKTILKKCCMKMWHFRFPLVVFRVLATREKIEGEWNINHKPMWHYIPCLWPEWLLYYSSHLHIYGRKEKQTKTKTSAVWKRQANFRYINFHRRERETFCKIFMFCNSN
jgi:hypothetical protein